ncbi:hypothetical protein HP062_24230 [Pseudomonas sp. B14-6]|uniref:hypothetical protein n=1 Tax=Pseudomonas sp. B14-6 TaxID=2738843 RepID=UPI00155E8D84|nr:hypothetical protein [Pseudomonas sp. B14-6]QKG68471.1 hypothetical protein HP062_24230 [Pseudomonas sp. B14-6]
MNTFSFRADCLADVLDLLGSTRMEALRRVTIIPDGTFPDVEVELDSGMTQKQLLSLMGGVEDGHVMSETLRMCNLRSNPMER